MFHVEHFRLLPNHQDFGLLCAWFRSPWDADYYPFGGWSIFGTINCQPQYRYTLMETEPSTSSDVDYAMYRYHSHRFARFMSPDPILGDPSNPQSWNRYAYVLNSPTGLIDPLGLEHGEPSFHTSRMEALGSGCSMGFTAYGVGCINNYVNGIEVPPLVAMSLLSMGVAVNCPQCKPGQVVGADNKIYDWIAPTYARECVGSFLDSACGPYVLKNPGGWQAVGSAVVPANNDVPVGMDIFRNSPQCPNCADTWRNASGAANTAFVATGVVLVGVPLAGEAATSAAGDFLFSRGTGLLNSNNYIRIGWAWARTSLLDYPYGGLTYFGIRILNWHVNGPIWSYPSH